MSKLQHCVYVLLSLKDYNLYIGYTSDLKQRLWEKIFKADFTKKFRSNEIQCWKTRNEDMTAKKIKELS